MQTKGGQATPEQGAMPPCVVRFELRFGSFQRLFAFPGGTGAASLWQKHEIIYKPCFSFLKNLLFKLGELHSEILNNK